MSSLSEPLLPAEADPADGGDVELVEVTEQGVVRVRLQGACHGCPMSMMTLKNGIERIIREQVPGVTAVEAV